MCGIAGLLSKRGASEEAAARLIGPIAHRGPDDFGTWADPGAGVAFGHRRLSIVDLSPAGHEPMHSASGRLVVTYNGEIYNHRELRGRLEANGQVPEGGWRGHSDIETFLQAIDCWGLEQALAEAVGMFAFALWDRKDRTLRLVRDRFGEKPLYYGWVGGDFLFASELKAIRAHSGFDNPVARQALARFAARSYIPAPLSIYQRIYKLEPGCVLTVGIEACGSPADRPPAAGALAGGGVRLGRYWSYRQVVRDGLADPITDGNAALEALDQALAAAVRGQSVADVPVGAFLSGGIDSSTVTACYQKHSSIPIRTFTIGFEEAGYNEAEHAKAVARHLGSLHNEHYVTVSEAQDVIPRLAEMYDEPFADSSQIPTFLVSRFAREQVTVALTGDGGDELFGGYNRHVLAPALWATLRRVPRPLRAVAGSVMAGLPPSLWGRVARAATGHDHRHSGTKVRKWLRIAAGARTYDEVLAGFLDEWLLEPGVVIGETAAAPDPDLCADTSPAVWTMYRDAVDYLPDDILCKVDRASMAVSLETRVPFLDHRLAALAARIPLRMKIGGGEGKKILRTLLTRDVPKRLIDRPKAGFGVPIAEWLCGPLRDWAEDLLDPAKLGAEGYFEPAMVRERWADHLAGRRDSVQALWSILMFQAWLGTQD